MGIYRCLQEATPEELLQARRRIHSDQSVQPDTRRLAADILLGLHDAIPDGNISRPTLQRDLGVTRHAFDKALNYLANQGLYGFQRTLPSGVKHIDGRHPIVCWFSAKPVLDTPCFPYSEQGRSGKYGFNSLISETKNPIVWQKSITDTTRGPLLSCSSFGGWSDTDWDAEFTPAPVVLPDITTTEAPAMLTPDLDQAQEFVDLIGGGERHWRTIDDLGDRDDLTVKLRGDLGSVADQLSDMQQGGAGVFATVGISGARCKSADITDMKVLFVDLDKDGMAGLHKIKNFPLKPHMVVESSKGKYHCYWRVDNIPVLHAGELEPFRLAQKALAERFGGDPVVCDLPRIMRVPGYWHMKATPFQTRIRWRADHESHQFQRFAKVLKLQERRDRLAAPAAPESRTHSTRLTPRGVAAGNRNGHVFRVALACVKRHMPEQDVLQEALAVAQACTPPLPHQEVRAVVRSAMRYR